MSETIEQREELQGILFIYCVMTGSGDDGWKWAVDMLIAGRRCAACEPTTYTTRASIGPPMGDNKQEPSEAERITDGFIRAQQWVMDYLSERDWVGPGRPGVPASG